MGFKWETVWGGLSCTSIAKMVGGLIKIKQLIL